MKKIYLLMFFLFVGLSGFSQSARLVLVEEFTGETCGPCAVSNPGFNAKLNSMPGQVIALKYQNNIPSAGPNFYAYNTADVANRTTYYSNTYSPHGFIDGNYWDGNVASVTLTQLNNRANVTSPFDIEVSHSFSPTYDMIYVTAVIRATQAVNGTSLRARCAIAERNVYGYTSPNGESSYEHVMRKLLPNGTGTVLPSSWAAGDSVVLDLSWLITVPTNPNIDLPLWSMLEAIVWVQEDSNKEIKQAGHSPAVVTLDPSVGDPQVMISCGSAAPEVEITNNEIDPITSLEIEYNLSGQPVNTYTWNGMLTQGNSVNIPLPSVTFSPGPQTLTASIISVNGIPDIVPTNNTMVSPAGAPVAPVSGYTNDFSAIAFPPVNWLEFDEDGTAGWGRATQSTSGIGSMKMDFYNSADGQVDHVYSLIPFDLSTATSPSLSFNLAHRQYPFSASVFSQDKIEILASTDCGANWTTVWSKTGSNLATVVVTAGQTGAFVPVAANWRFEVADLSLFTAQPEVLIAFKATSDYGNNAYIDDINLNLTTGINESAGREIFDVYPVPSTGAITIDMGGSASSDVMIIVSSLSGKIVKEMQVAKAGNTFNLDLSEVESGNYFIRLTSGNETSVKKVAIIK